MKPEQALYGGVWCQVVSAEMALDVTMAIAPDLAGQVLAFMLVSTAMCAGATAALLARSRRRGS